MDLAGTRTTNGQNKTCKISPNLDPRRQKKESIRPKETWRRTIERERNESGLHTWAEATKVAQDRTRWR